MAYQALYRKWRPQTFDEVRGQDAIVTTLKNQIKSDRIGHAYLFCGTRGTGKTTVAKIFARAVNCPHAKEHDGNPCNTCAVCTAISAGRSMNVFEIDAASNNGVDNIRDIREQVEYPPTEGRFKVYIIDEVHMLSTGAFNALLKTLEEPPEYVIFILATTDPQKLPQTILSRCQRYDFRRISADIIAARIRELADSEQLDIEEQAVRYLARAADGALRDGLSLLDQCLACHYGERLTYAHVLESLGAADASAYSALYRAVLSGHLEEALSIVERSIDAGCEIGAFLTDFIWYLRNVLLCMGSRDNAQAAQLLDVADEDLARLRADGEAAEKPRLLRMMYALSELSNRMRFASGKRVLLEVEVIRLCTEPLMKESGGSGAGARAFEQRQPSDGRVERYGEGRTESRMDGGTEEPRAPMSPKITLTAKIAETMSRKNTEPEPQIERVQGLSERESVPESEAASLRPDARIGEGQGAAESGHQAAGASADKAGTDGSGEGTPGADVIELLRANWDELVSELNPSNRAVFSGVVLKEENGRPTVVFRNTINYKIAATNREENGLLRLRQLAESRFGLQVSFTARIARPGEFAAQQDRATEEELGRINFPIDIEG